MKTNVTFERNSKLQFTAVWYNISKGANMTTKKYIFTFVLFFILLVAAPILFFSGFFLKEKNVLIFCVFASIACISLISAIAVIVLNYKKLVARNNKVIF